MQGLLATQLNHLVHEGVEENSIIRLEKFVKNVVAGRHLVVALKMQTIGTNPGHRLGEPVDVATKEGGAENVPPQQQQQQNAGGLYGANNNNNKPSHVKPEATDNNNMQRNNSNPYGGGRGNSNSNNPYGSSSNSRHSPIVRTTPGGTAFTPIANLNMYQSRWTIRARITNKSDIRTWSNARGEGSLFSIDVLDSSGIDVRCWSILRRFFKCFWRISLSLTHPRIS